MTRLNLSADALLSTTRAVRKRLDFDRPVEDEVIRQCLELAIQSPTGSNAQTWQWVVVTDADKKRALGELYARAWNVYRGMDRGPAGIATSDEARAAQQERVIDSAQYLADRIGEVPAMLIPCLPGRMDRAPNIMAASMYGSILPGVWSFMLAARERGLGTAFTTLHLAHESEAAAILGIPYDQVTQVALVTIGYTKGTDFKPAKRAPLDEVLHWNSW